MKKSIFALMAAMLLVFGWAGASLAADACGTCYPICNIAEPEESYGEQGEITYTCTYFDFETAAGYCDDCILGKDGGKYENMAWFNACLCQELVDAYYKTQNPETGMRVKFKGEIIVRDADGNIKDPGGVVFADCSQGPFFQMSSDFECDEPCYENYDVTPQCLTGAPMTFGPGDAAPCTGNLCVDSCTGLYKPAECNSCIECDYRATYFQTCCYKLPAYFLDNFCCYWKFDFPAMRYDASLMKRGDAVSILLTIEGCGGCEPFVCICEIPIGVYGCYITSNNCIYFPYVITKYEDPPWTYKTGIVVTNMNWDNIVPPSQMKATLTLSDQQGRVFRYTKDDFTSTIWAFYMDDIVDLFTPYSTNAANGVIEKGRGWLKVETNFQVDGFQYIVDDANAFGGMTLPRPCGWPCVTCVDWEKVGPVPTPNDVD